MFSDFPSIFVFFLPLLFSSFLVFVLSLVHIYFPSGQCFDFKFPFSMMEEREKNPENWYRCDAEDAYVDACAKVAEFIGCRKENLVLVENCNSGKNIIFPIRTSLAFWPRRSLKTKQLQQTNCLWAGLVLHILLGPRTTPYHTTPHRTALHHTWHHTTPHHIPTIPHHTIPHYTIRTTSYHTTTTTILHHTAAIPLSYHDVMPC